MHIRTAKTWLRAACTAALLAAGGMAALAGDDVVKTRQAAMKSMGVQLKAIKGIIDAGGMAADVISPANRIADIAAQIPALFPIGTDRGDTSAKPEIWQDWGAFAHEADELQAEARLLASAGGSGDIATVRAQFDKAANVCGDCHREFRHRR